MSRPDFSADLDTFEAAMGEWADETGNAVVRGERARSPEQFIAWAEGLDLEQEAADFCAGAPDELRDAIMRVAVLAGMREAWGHLLGAAEGAIESKAEDMRDR